MILLDVNVLPYAHREESSRRPEFRRWLEAALDGAESCAISDPALSGASRILTHPRVFDPPTPLATAIDFGDRIRRHDRIAILASGPRHREIFLDWRDLRHEFRT